MQNLTLTMKSNKFFSVFAVLALVFGMFASVLTSPKAQAEELAHKVTKATLTTNGTVAAGENMDLEFAWSVTDSTPINNGDTITLTLPDTIAFPTTLSGQQLTVGGQPVGTYTLDASTGKITLTFDTAGAAYFVANPLGKGGELGVKVVTSRSTNTNADPKTIKVGSFEGVDLGSIDFEGAGDGSVDSYTFKYGYLDPKDPTLVKWKILVNAKQDILRGKMTITDTIGVGHTLEGNIRAVRLAYKVGGYKSESEATAASVHSRYDVAISGQTFTITNGDGSQYSNVYGGGTSGPEYSPAVWIEYSTRITDPSVVAGEVANTLKVEANNFPPREITKTVKFDYLSWAVAWGAKQPTAVITAKKVLQGKALTDGEFKFGLYEVKDDKETLVEEVTNKADGSITFAPISYTSAGLRQYVVRENAGSDPIITYSNTVLEYKVNVTNENGVYLAQVGAPTDTTFTNTYVAPTTTTVAPATTAVVPIATTVEPVETTVVPTPATRSVLPRTGTANNPWLVVAGLTILAVAGGFFYVSRKEKN